MILKRPENNCVGSGQTFRQHCKQYKTAKNELPGNM